jgi:hypothetical protein
VLTSRQWSRTIAAYGLRPRRISNIPQQVPPKNRLGNSSHEVFSLLTVDLNEIDDDDTSFGADWKQVGRDRAPVPRGG